MVHICAWCERFLGIKEPAGSHAITHGICESCYERQSWSDVPTLVVSPERAHLLPVLSQLLRGAPEIKVVLDRRRADRRAPAETAVAGGGERRQEDRRRTTALYLC
jgi:hypothetical protein